MRLSHRILAGHPGAILVFGHLQRTLIVLQGGLQQTFLLIDHPQLQVVLHQFRLLAQAHGSQVGETGLGTGFIGFQGAPQFAPDVGFPTDPCLSAVGVADTAGRAAQARTAAAGALAGAVLADGQVHRGKERPPGTARQCLGLTVLGFGLGHGLVGGIEFFHQAIELCVSVQFPPGTTSEGVAGVGLAPALGLLVLRRRGGLRALIIRANRTGAEHGHAQRQAQCPRATGSRQRCDKVEKRTVGHSGVSRAASVRTPRQRLKRWRSLSR